MPPVFALLAAPPELLRATALAELRSDIPRILIGVLLVAVGLSSLLLFRLRTRSKDPALLWFGVFAALYGLRLLVLTNFLRFTATPVPYVFWAYLASAITYAILLPAALFLMEIIPAWRSILRPLAWFQAAFAVAGVAADLARRRPESLSLINNAEVVLLFVAMAVALLREPGHTLNARTLQIGTLGFTATVLANNVANLASVRLPFDPEPLGFTIFLAALGRVVALRLIAGEERLASINKELEIARRIQASILPQKIPQLAGLTIAARYLPMSEVAGDFYDFLALDEHRIGVLIADVSGHGVPAALIASMVKVAVAGQLPHASDPARVLAGMNQTLSGKLKGQFVTAAYLFLDLASGTMRYASAGHPAMMRRRGGEPQVDKVSANGLALGLSPRSVYRFVEHTLIKGDRFLLYTDGLLEARNPAGELFGEHRACELLSAAPVDADGCAASLVAGLVRWTGASAAETDDLTLVVVDVTPRDVRDSSAPTPPGRPAGSAA